MSVDQSLVSVLCVKQPYSIGVKPKPVLESRLPEGRKARSTWWSHVELLLGAKICSAAAPVHSSAFIA